MRTEEEYTEVRSPPKVYLYIEKEVVNLYKKLKIRSVPIDLFKIASKLGYIVKPYSSLDQQMQDELQAKECEGVSLYNTKKCAFMIFYDNSFSRSRIRFTIMHEIGHIFLGHKEESILAKRMADYFAAYALAPSPLISHFKCEDYIDVSNIFDTSPECAINCFHRFTNRNNYGNNYKPHEFELLDLFQ